LSRSGVFYAIKAMERVATGTTGADAPGVAPGGAVAHDARAAASPDGSASSVTLRVLDAIRHSLGRAVGIVGRGRPRLGRAARVD
jgi:hypothetical protein